MQEYEKGVKKIAKGGAIVFLGTVVGGFTGMLLHLLLSRTLGAKDYGLYMLGFSLFIVAHSVLSLGLHKGVLRFVAVYKGTNDVSRVKGTLLFVLTVAPGINILGGIIIYLFSNYIAIEIFAKPALGFVLKIFAIALPFYNIFVICYFSLQAFQKTLHYTALKNILQPSINIAIVSVLLLLVGMNLGWALCAYLATVVLVALAGLRFLWHIFPELVSRVRPMTEARVLLRYSTPLLFAGIAYIFLSYIDKIMIGYFRVSKDVGIYSIAAKLAIQIRLILVCVNVVFGPIIADLNNKGKLNEIELLFKTSTRWILTLIIPLVLIYILFSRDIMLLFGTEFGDGWLILVILACAYLAAAGTGSVGLILNMTGRQDIELVNTLCMVGLNIGLNIWLIQAYGMLGAAIATAVSIGLVNLAKLIEVKIFLGFQPYDKKYLKPLLVGGGIFLLYVLLLNNIDLSGFRWVPALLILAVGYFAILFLLGFEQDDKIVLRAVKDKIAVMRQE